MKPSSSISELKKSPSSESLKQYQGVIFIGSELEASLERMQKKVQELHLEAQVLIYGDGNKRLSQIFEDAKADENIRLLSDQAIAIVSGHGNKEQYIDDLLFQDIRKKLQEFGIKNELTLACHVGSAPKLMKKEEKKEEKSQYFAIAGGSSKHPTILEQNDQNIFTILELIYQNNKKPDKDKLTPQQILKSSASLRPSTIYLQDKDEINKYPRFGKFTLKEIEEILKSDHTKESFDDDEIERILFNLKFNTKEHFDINNIKLIGTDKDSEREKLGIIFKKELAKKLSKEGIIKFIEERFGKENIGIKTNIKLSKQITNKFQTDALLMFTANNNIDELELMIENGININAKNSYGSTTLMIACEKGLLEIVKYLIEKGADINTKNSYGFTTLMIACENGHLEIVKYLIEKGVPINTQNVYGLTALMIACEKGHLEIAEYLIERSIILIQADSGITALILASAKGHLEIVKCLIKEGTSNSDQINALVAASQLGQLEIVKYLICCGVSSESIIISEAAENVKPFINEVNEMLKLGCTKLMIAANYGDVDTFKIAMNSLLKFDDKKGDAEALINKQQSTGGLSALMIAVLHNKSQIVNYLIGAGADIDLKDKNGRTALTHAVKENCAEAIMPLIENGADINAKNSDGLTPLLIALDNNNYKICKILVENGAAINQKTPSGENILDYLIKSTKDSTDIEISKINLIAKLLEKTPNFLSLKNKCKNILQYSEIKSLFKKAELIDILDSKRIKHFVMFEDQQIIDLVAIAEDANLSQIKTFESLSLRHNSPLMIKIIKNATFDESISSLISRKILSILNSDDFFQQNYQDNSLLNAAMERLLEKPLISKLSSSADTNQADFIEIAANILHNTIKKSNKGERKEEIIKNPEEYLKKYRKKDPESKIIIEEILKHVKELQIEEAEMSSSLSSSSSSRGSLSTSGFTKKVESTSSSISSSSSSPKAEPEPSTKTLRAEKMESETKRRSIR